MRSVESQNDDRHLLSQQKGGAQKSGLGSTRFAQSCIAALLPPRRLSHGKTLEVRLLVAECGIIWICGGFVGAVGDVKEFANEGTTQRFAAGCSGLTARLVTVLPVRIC
jgi:hypothetical protein